MESSLPNLIESSCRLYVASIVNMGCTPSSFCNSYFKESGLRGNSGMGQTLVQQILSRRPAAFTLPSTFSPKGSLFCLLVPFPTFSWKEKDLTVPSNFLILLFRLLRHQRHTNKHVLIIPQA